MKNQLLLLCAVLWFATIATAQPLIPYLGANGKYGYSDEQGKVVIPTIYETPGDIIPTGKIFTTLKSGNDKQPVLLLRNGQKIQATGRGSYAVGARNYSADNRLIDSIAHLIVVFGEREVTYHDLRNHTQKAFQNLIVTNSLNWFSNLYKPMRQYLDPLPFTHGFAEVWKSKDAMNFVDVNLKEIFPRDFPAGRVADASHFILAENEDHFAIGDRSGKVRTPFVWTNIIAGGQEGHFIVTGPRYPFKKSGIVGMIDADGRIIIDTIYRTIKPFGPFLIVEKDERLGLLDHSGRIVRPITARSMYPVARGRLLMVNEYDANGSNARSNLLDQQGKSLLPETVRGIGTFDTREFPHFWLQFPDYNAIYDTALHEIATFRGFDSGEIVETNPFVFKLSKINGNKYEFGLYNRESVLLHPAGFDEMVRVFPHVYRVKKDSLFGVINSKGEFVIPVKYSTIRAESNPRDSIFWCEERNGRWAAYRLKNNAIFEDKRIITDGYNDPIAAFKSSGYNGPVTAIFEDGTRRLVPDSLKEWQLQRQIRTPVGDLLVYARYRNGGFDKLYLNERFQNIVQPGFVALPATEETGLVAVMRLKVAKPAPKREPEIMVVPEPAIKEMVPEEPPRSRAYSSGDFDACGVLGADGNWVLPPKAEVAYQPLSMYMVLETPIGQPYKQGNLYPGTLRVHRVNQPAQPPIEVQYIRYLTFERGVSNIQMGKAIQKQRERIATAYFDKKGRQLTPFGVYQGPIHLKSRNIVTIVDYDNPKKSKTVAINEQGEPIFDLGNLTCGKMPHTNGGNWKFDYVVAMEQLSVEESERIAKMPIEELSKLVQKARFPQGILDSTGRLVQPLKYFSLQIVAPDRLFCSRDTNGTAMLFNWKGELMHYFPNRPVLGYQNSDPVSVMTLKNGQIVLGDGITSVLVSADNRLVKVFKDSHSGASDMDGLIFQMKTKDQKTYWVRSSDGLEYRQ
ncbi:MAG: WG repeat-containing protein [Saprospiraceae bacterium]|nr:WG repeat-containing protein [Saprospiraceae bacterium]